ncbi:MAG: tetratricopeptide repeat protein [Bacteroidales bacterium]|nr:tetratricopeptide repeat protein [Bacteroidales bacterium]
MRNIIYIITILLLASCASHSPNVKKADSRYQRAPIVEVTEGQLKLETEQLQAATQLAIGDAESAVMGYREILKQNPAYPPAHYELGRIYLSVGWVDSALIHAQQAFAGDADNYWYERLLAQIFEKKQDSKNLTATWEDIVKRHPDRPDYYYDLSNAYLQAGNIVSSIEVLDRAEKKFGINEEVSLHKQRLWNALNRPDKARKELEKLAEAVPNDTRYNAILAESYMTEKNYAKALSYYQRILNSNPNDENIHISIASCYLTMGDHNQAYRHLRIGLLNPNNGCQHRLMFLTEFLRNKDFFTAYSHPCMLLADTIAMQGSPSDGHTLLYGQLLAAQERYTEAAQQFLLHLKIDKSQYETWEALLLCESMISDTNPNLLEHARQASELFPLHLRPYLILAQGYYSLGDCAQAHQYIERCLMVAPNDNQTKHLNDKIQQLCQ